MSSVSIQPNAGGAGVFTISAPSSSTNYTLNLPAENGTILTSASSTNLGSKIQPIDASTNAGTMTVTLYPTVLDFRSATTSSGTVNTRTINSALTITIPNGATLGTINGVTSTIMVLALDNAGTVELGVINLAGGVNLSEINLISTTAINTSSPALNSSNNVVYSAAARSTVPYRVVGFVQSTQATAGYWNISAGTTTVQGIGGQAMAGMNTLGYGQTWQDVTSLRALGTTYYNTTARPIAVSLYQFYGTSQTGTLTVNGIQTSRTSTGTNAGSLYFTHFAIVPPGGSYVASGPSLTAWNELR